MTTGIPAVGDTVVDVDVLDVVAEEAVEPADCDGDEHALAPITATAATTAPNRTQRTRTLIYS